MKGRWLVTALTVTLLAGCGGSGVGPIPPGQQAKGKVVLPAGCSVQPVNLTVLSSTGRVAVRGDGSFVTRAVGSGPAQVILVDRAGRPVLLGYVDASDPDGGEISARETAVALIWDALVTFAPPPAHWAELLTAIRADPRVGPLATVIEQQLVSDPAALSKRNPAIRAALAEAVSELAGMVPKSAPRPEAVAAAGLVSVAQDGTVSLVEGLLPEGQQSGLTLTQAVGSNGVRFTNYFRRHCLWHACRIGYEDTDGHRHNIRPWQSVTPSDMLTRYISATTGLDGVIGTLQGLLFGQVPYAPSEAEPFALPVEPSGVQKTFYWICVVGPNSEDFEGKLASLPDLPASEKAAIRNSLTFTSAVTSFNEVFLPLIFSVLPADSIEDCVKSKQFSLVAYDCFMLMTKYMPGLVTEVAEGDVRGAMSKMVTLIRDHREVREGVLKLMQNSGYLKKMVIAETAEALAKKAAMVLQVADVAVQLFDAGAVVVDIGQSAALPEWQATGVKPFIRLSPDPANVSSGSRVNIVCLGTAGITGTKQYQWSTPGNYGHLEDGKGNSGREFTSTAGSVTYVAAQGIKTDQSETVHVVAHLKQGTQTIKLGEGQATVLIAPEAPGYQRANMRVVEWGPVVRKVSKDWRATYYVANVGTWKSDDVGAVVIIHYPENSPPDDKTTRYLTPDETMTKDELIAAFDANVWGLADGELGYAVWSTSTSAESDAGAEDALAWLNVRLDDWKKELYNSEGYQKGTQWWFEAPAD